VSQGVEAALTPHKYTETITDTVKNTAKATVVPAIQSELTRGATELAAKGTLDPVGMTARVAVQTGKAAVEAALGKQVESAITKKS
jgi:hypothetical protein